MTIAETLDGSLKLTLNHPTDRDLLTSLILDAGAEGSQGLVRHVCQHMQDEDWNEYVQPDLLSKYQQDVATVTLQVKKVLDDESEELLIQVNDFRYWYSTLNQARLNLEELFKLSKIEEPLETIEYNRVEASIKSEFYMHLQSLLLDFLKL